MQMEQAAEAYIVKREKTKPEKKQNHQKTKQ